MSEPTNKSGRPKRSGPPRGGKPSRKGPPRKPNDSWRKGGSGKSFKGKSSGDKEGRGWSRPPRVELTNAQRARKAAAMAVTDVLGRGFRLEGSLAKNPALEGLDPRDRAFARAIAATTLRRLGQINKVLDPLVQRPPPGRVQAYLQTATAQMVFMDVAPHAAVGDTVGLIKADSKSEPFTGLANAVLRKVADTGKADAARTPPTENIPGWLRSDWTRSYGKAAVRRMALLLATAPPLDLSVKSDPEGWASKLGGAVMGETTVRLDSIGNVAALEGYEDGSWWAQDVAAALPVRVLQSVMGDMSSRRVADLCAAPGGKTMQLIAMGADVTAVDLSEARTERMRQNLTRTRMEADIVTADISEYESGRPFDAVLLDSPCSATGTFRRHPDVLYNRREKDITPLTRLQDKLLKQAAKNVAPNGYLLYSVCSLQERESAERVRKLIKAMPEFGLVSVSSVPGLAVPEERFADGMIRILPPDAPDGRGMDGFFIAVLKRSGKTGK